MTPLSLNAVDVLLASGALRRTGPGSFARALTKWTNWDDDDDDVFNQTDVQRQAAEKLGGWFDSMPAAQVMVACLGVPRTYDKGY